MSALLHVPSLLIAAAVTGACVSASHLLIWRAVRSEMSVLLWGLGYGLTTLSMVMAGLRGYIPSSLSVVVSNVFLLLALGFIWLGYRRFIGKRGRYDGLLASLGGLAWLIFACDRQLFANINLRVEMVSVVQFAYLLAVGFDLIDHWRKEPLPALLLTVGAIGIQQLLLLTRIVYLLISPVDPATINIPADMPIALTLIGSTGFIVFFGLLQLALVGQRSERRFRIAAETDSLTGLANRGRFLGDVLSHLATSPGRGALVLFDLDHFKQVNDTYGHLMGDRSLAEFARILAGATPERAVAARIGGEEFAIFLPEADVATAISLAERVRELTHGLELHTPSDSLRITVSGGIASVAEIGPDYEALHGAADIALYRAKSDGRDRISIYRQDPPTSQSATASKDRGGRPVTAMI